MTPSTWAFVVLFGITVYHVALRVSAWIGRTVGPWFLVVLGLAALVFSVAYLVVGEIRDRKRLDEQWASVWWCEK